MKSKKIIAKISNIYKKQRRGSAPLLYSLYHPEKG